MLAHHLVHATNRLLQNNNNNNSTLLDYCQILLLLQSITGVTMVTVTVVGLFMFTVLVLVNVKMRKKTNKKIK